MHFIHCIQLFLHFNFPFISPLSKYLFPPSFHKFISIFPSSSLYALSSTVYHNVHTQLFPKRYYTSIFEPIFILSSPTSSNNFQLFYLIKVIPTANIFFFLPYTQFHQLQRTTTTKTTCQQR